MSIYSEYIERWKAQEETGNVGNFGAISKHVRRYLFDKYDAKCALCGWDEVNPHTEKKPLTVHHIDGDSTNSFEENLILLCPNCHSLTETYGSRNRGKGRKNRHADVIQR